jgi:hypothetical protein
MYDYYKDHNNLIPGQVTPSLRVAWSRARCWHGDQVTILVQSELAKDGSKLELEIISKTNSTSIDSIKGLTLSNQQAQKTYTIDWKDKSLPQDECEYIVKAKVPDHGLEAQSGVLYVDLISPGLSF